MSTNLSTGSETASPPNPAATDSTVSADSAADSSAASSAERTDSVAASGEDAIANLDRDYKQSMLGPKDEEGEAQPEKTQPEKPVELKPEEEVPVEEPEVDPLEEVAGPRTVEQLKKQFPRVSDKPLEEIARVEAEAFKLQQEFDSVGGTVGMEIAKAVIPALLSASPTDEEIDGLFQNVTETNPALMLGMSWKITTHALNEKSLDPATGRPINVVTGDALIKQFLSDKESVESLQKLIAYKDAGLIDEEKFDEELELYSGKSEQVRALEARLQAIESEKSQEKAAQEDKSAERINQHVARTEKYVSDGAMTRVVAIAEEYGWTATKEELNSPDPAVKEAAEFKVALGELLTPWLDHYVRSHVKWAGIESIGKEERAFNADGNPTVLLKKNGEDLINAATAAFKQKVRTMNKAFQKMAGSSRNVRLKEKTTRSGAVDPSEIPPVKKLEENGNRGSDPIAKLDEEYRRSVRG